jgi:2-C-methyl-D-erythritol 4-phosphate cytidylyltransferase
VATAVIVAAGRGTRMNTVLPKPYLSVAGRPVLGHTLKRFDACPRIEGMVVVVAEADMELCRSAVIEPSRLKKPIRLVAGGARRQESVFNALAALTEETVWVAIHDGVRLFVDDGLIAACIDGAAEYGACIPAIPAYETVKQVDDGLRIEATLRREGLWLAQTPQVFRLALIREAHRKAQAEGFVGTDDAMLLERLGMPVTVVAGRKTNIKITTPEDLQTAEALLQARSRRPRSFS